MDLGISTSDQYSINKAKETIDNKYFNSDLLNQFQISF